MKDFFYCIDIGGTFIKSGIVSSEEIFCLRLK